MQHTDYDFTEQVSFPEEFPYANRISAIVFALHQFLNSLKDEGLFYTECLKTKQQNKTTETADLLSVFDS